MLSWRPELAALATDLARRVAADGADAFDEALDREIRAQADAFLRGLERYRNHPYRRRIADPPAIWEEGTTRLLDYAPEGGTPLLVVPSLVNRGYVLDLAAERSFLRHLAGRGIRPLLVDWGAPGPLERGFSLTDYVAGRLEAALDAALERCRGKVAVLGYCMGGLLALALAQRRRRDIAALVLLATPWDFHAEQRAQAQFLGALAEPLAAAFTALGELPVDVIQALFFAADPMLALRKFSRFAETPPASRRAEEFVALEDWLNDGIPLALPTAREALAQFYGENATAAGNWRIAGRRVDPASLDLPALVVVPARDRIVPPRSAAALAASLPWARRLTPPLGHIGMIVGGGAEDAVWRPAAEWLLAAGAPAGWTRG